MTAKAIKKQIRGGGPRALASSLSAVTKTVFGKRGFADGAIVKDWVTIAGEHLARHSLPEKISTPRDKAAGGGALPDHRQRRHGDRTATP